MNQEVNKRLATVCKMIAQYLESENKKMSKKIREREEIITKLKKDANFFKLISKIRGGKLK